VNWPSVHLADRTTLAWANRMLHISGIRFAMTIFGQQFGIVRIHSLGKIKSFIYWTKNRLNIIILLEIAGTERLRIHYSKLSKSTGKEGMKRSDIVKYCTVSLS